MSHRVLSAARRQRAGLIAFVFLLWWAAAFETDVKAAFPGDNGRIAFTRGVVANSTTVRFGIDAVGPGGGDERPLVSRAQSPAWAPDGRHVAFAALGADGRGNGIAVVNAEGSDRRRITADADDGAPAWSPDGRWLAFHRFRTPAPGVIAPSVYVVRADGTHLRRIAAGAFPAWGVDGRIAFVRRVATRAPFFDGIFVIRSDGSALRRVTSRVSDNAPDWSPGGTRLVFTRGPAVYKIRVDGKQLRRVTPAGEWPAWSPDGARIVFTHRQAIRTVRTDGTALRVLTRPRNDDFGPADWQPTPSASEATATTVRVYFGAGSQGLGCSRVVGRPRSVWMPATLRGALDALLWGPSAAERAAGDGGWFSSATAGMVRGVNLSRGVASIDFKDLRPIIPNASTSCGSELLLAQLDRTATQFATVDRAVYSINGSRRVFYEWLQREPPG